MPTDGGLLRIVAVSLGLAALVLFLEPAPGLRHDGLFYSLQALARLHPEALADDLFFRFGSQDAYTLFSPLYAAAIAWLGLDAAALAAAALGKFLFVAAAALLALALLPRRWAWLALALIVVIPGKYGADDVFAYGESFVTPRPYAEAAVLAALAALAALPTRGPALVPWLLLALGLLLHPLMAFPGVLLAVLWATPDRRHGALVAAGAAAFLAAAVVAHWAPLGPLALVDGTWRERLVDYVPYVLLDQWHFLDWQRALVPLLTLALAVVVLGDGHDARLARLARVAALVGVAGLALAALATYVVPVALVLQGQPWRWCWLSKVVAVLLLVPVACALWRRGAPGRAVALLLGVAWLGAEDTGGLPGAAAALLLALLDRRGGALGRWVAPVALCCTAALGYAVVEITGASETVIALAVAATGWWALFVARGRTAAAAVAVVAAAGFADQFARAVERIEPRPAAGPALAAWQARIAPAETVLHVRNPSAVWLQLQRKSFQIYAGAVFSRDAALASHGREVALRDYAADAEAWFRDDGGALREPRLDAALFERLCAHPEIDHVITDDPLPVPRLDGPLVGPFAGTSLYPCPRDAGSAR